MEFPGWLRVVGDRSFKGDCPSEAAELTTFFNALRNNYDGVPALHIRNEGKRTKIQGVVEKAQGMHPGAADIIIPGSPTLVIELKRMDHRKSRWQPYQLDFLRDSMLFGARVSVCLGHRAALQEFIEWHRSLNITRR